MMGLPIRPKMRAAPRLVSQPWLHIGQGYEEIFCGVCDLYSMADATFGRDNVPPPGEGNGRKLGEAFHTCPRPLASGLR